MGGPTLTRFFSFHFVLPFVGAALSMVHILALHREGTSRPVGRTLRQEKVDFSPLFI